LFAGRAKVFLFTTRSLELTRVHEVFLVPLVADITRPYADAAQPSLRWEGRQ